MLLSVLKIMLLMICLIFVPALSATALAEDITQTEDDKINLSAANATGEIVSKDKASESADPELDKKKEKKKGPDWMLLMSPSFGYLYNTAKFSYEIPHQGETQSKVSDGGFGGGFVMLGFYKWLSLTNVFFAFPKVNDSLVLGDILFLSGSIPTGTFVEPYLGFGGLYTWIRRDAKDMQIIEEDEMFGKPMIAFADIKALSLENNVAGFFPKLGLKFKIPIQHWYIEPFYSYLYEDVRTHAQSDGGHVDVYELGMRGIKPPEVSADIKPFDTRLAKTYHSHLIGFNWLIDFHYFIQMRGSFNYNVNHDLVTVRTIGSFMFHEYVGIVAYFEYSQKITVTNTYFLVGPAFFFTPRDFREKLLRKR